MNINQSRRRVFKVVSIALAAVPLALVTRCANAATNPDIRAKLKYQDTPLGDQSCANCLAFVPGKTEKNPGKCPLIPGDDDISPNGYCTGWYTM